MRHSHSNMKKKLYTQSREAAPDGFRYRGVETTRLENLTDAVFGFSITLLVISSQVPTTYLELQSSMYSFFGFIFCTMLLLGLWNNHNNFFLRYGLQDTRTKLLNSLFLFVLLFYIYPLKYLFSFVGTAIWVNIMRDFGHDSPAFQLALEQLVQANMSADQWVDLMIRFGLGHLFIHSILFLMHINALRQKEDLDLSAKEVFLTWNYLYSYLILMVISVLSILIVLIWGGYGAAYSGWIYASLPFLFFVLDRIRRRQKRKRFPEEDN